jgi:hydrogenase maturation protein HypF
VSPANTRLRLHCRGVVQGVGFRPCVHRLASSLALGGWVENLAGSVLMELSGSRPQLEAFVRRLPGELPPGARLEPLQPQWLPAPDSAATALPPGIRIAAAAAQPLGPGLVAPSLAADRAPCAACLAELADPTDRRFGYPYLSCSACGPRYSIATGEPYARAHTTLAAFPLCPDCRREFEDPDDRRFHAEAIACPVCGPRLSLLDRQGQPLEGTDTPIEPIEAAAALLLAGQVLALQGVGGFQLLVEASDAQAVARLRRRKRRPGKPFALLVADPDWIAPHVCLDPAEREVLQDPAAPIVLLRRRPAAKEAFPGVAPGSPALGVMLPASPLHHLLSRAVGRPVVATSGNRSGEPLCIDPHEALERLAGLADAFLVHDRPIARPLDDSVLQLIEGRPALLRRARGFAPEPLDLGGSIPAAASEGAPAEGALALGSDLKCAPALAVGGRVWLAPHLGDLADSRVEERLRHGVAELLARHGDDLEAIACDAHPGWLSHQLAASTPLPFRGIPHHFAHALAVVAEHRLKPPLLAACWDGLGWGGGVADAPAHRLWGSELLLIQGPGPVGPGREVTRGRWLGGLRPFPLPGGERAMTEPRRAALGLLAAAGPAALEHPGAGQTREAFLPAERRLLLQAIASGCNSPLSSGAGRLFDAAASLLGLTQISSYEGEGGLLLQGTAAAEEVGAYPLPAGPDGHLEWRPLLDALLADVVAGEPVGVVAARFHRGLATGLAEQAAAAASRLGCRQVALAGGCFQNRLLLELAIDALRGRDLEPFWPEALPSNDGSLALGQLLAVGLPQGTCL